MIFEHASWIVRQQCTGVNLSSYNRVPLGAPMLLSISQPPRLCMALYSTSQICMRCLTGLIFMLLVTQKSIFIMQHCS
jgi:hypothetical protein